MHKSYTATPTQRHTHTETHSNVHGNRHTGYRYSETRTKRANQVGNDSRRCTQRHRCLHGDAQEVHPATHTGSHPRNTQQHSQSRQTGTHADAETAAGPCYAHRGTETQRCTEKHVGWKHIPQVHAHSVAHACRRSPTPTDPRGRHTQPLPQSPDKPAQPLEHRLCRAEPPRHRGAPQSHTHIQLTYTNR